MKFSPCLDIFFKDISFSQRIAKIASLGFTHYEFWTWWNKDVDKIAEANDKYKMKTAAFCTKFISLVDKNQRSAYLDGLGETIEVVKKIKTPIIISQVGNELEDVSRETQKMHLIDGLKESTKMLEGTNITLAIEPLNTLYDHKGYFLYSSSEAAEIVREVNSPHVKILFDVYHQQIMEGNLLNNIRQYSELIAHYHIADNPGRHEIGTGEINFPKVLETIDNTQYEGCVGIELFPLNSNHAEVLSADIFN